MTIKLELSNFVVTFDTQEEAAEFINSHSLPEERRLLWLGFMFGCNYAANQVNKTFNLEYKHDRTK